MLVGVEFALGEGEGEGAAGGFGDGEGSFLLWPEAASEEAEDTVCCPAATLLPVANGTCAKADTPSKEASAAREGTVRFN